MDYGKISLEKHAEWRGKIEIATRAPLDSAEAKDIRMCGLNPFE